MGNVSVHFDRAEFACKDGCGYANPRGRLLEVLEYIRALKKRPVRIVSGCRCCPHNHSVGGAVRSEHIYGSAADLSPDLRLTVAEARQAGAIGIGKNADGWVVHVDVRRGRAAVWTY